MHGKDAVYDVDALIGGHDSLSAEESAAVGDVAGLDVLHLQCHIGFDSISLARRGARVTGVDFSPASLAKARDLAQQCGVSIEWVEADAMELPESLHERFDVVYATIGVVCWIEDLGSWMRSAHSALRRGGRLVLVDGHPLLVMLETGRPLKADFAYGGGESRRFDLPGSYADPDADVAATESVEYAHSLGEIVTAAVRAGLRIEELNEHLDLSFEHRPGVPVLEEDGRWRLRLDGEPLPLLFTLRATRAE